MNDRINISDMRLKPGERGAVIGATGTGKSYASRLLIAGTTNLAVIDPKRSFPLQSDNDRVFSKPGFVRFLKPARFWYRPDESDISDLSMLDEIYRYCYQRGNITVYTDDVVGVMDNNRYPHFVRVCYQMGRSKGIGCLSCMQRPTGVPRPMITECTKFFIFRLIDYDDQKRARNLIPGYDANILKSKSRHHFYYYDHATHAEPRILRMPDMKGLI